MRKSEFDASKRNLINITKPPADANNVATSTVVPNPFPLSRVDAGSLVHNYGATGSATANLPTDAAIGEKFSVQEVAAQNIVMDPGANGIFIDGATTSTAGQKLTASAVASSVELICIDAGPTWLLRGKSGTWAIA